MGDANKILGIETEDITQVSEIDSGTIVEMMGTGVKFSVLPTGLIIPLNDTNIPDGWERFTSADDKHIVGAGNSYTSLESGGSKTITGIGTSSNGSHTGSQYSSNVARGDTGVSNYVATPIGVQWSPFNTYSAGNHNHDSCSADINIERQRIVLIKALADMPEYPSNAIVFTKQNIDPIGGLTGVHQDNRYMYSSPVIDSAASSITNTSANSAGAHAHHDVHGYNSLSNSQSRYDRYMTHGHTLSLSLSNESITHAYLKAWSSSNAFALASNIIGMWEGETPPDGWVLCDGNNDTIDLRDCFIKFSDDGNTGTKNVGSGQVTVSGSASSGGSHEHRGSNVGCYSIPYYNHGQNAGAHTHSISSQAKSFTPPYYALTFIMQA